MRPPIRLLASNTVTERPEPASLQAAASPEIPAPITMTLFASAIALIRATRASQVSANEFSAVIVIVRRAVDRYGITVILLRFSFDARKSGRLRANPKRGVGFEEAQEVFSHPYYLDQRSDLPEQYRAIGWVGGDLYTVIFEVREDEDKKEEYYHLVTLWKATKQEQKLYAEHS